MAQLINSSLKLSLVVVLSSLYGQVMANSEMNPLKCHAITTIHTQDDAKNKFEQFDYQHSLVGYGATTDRQDEITLVDGKLYLVSYKEEQYQTRNQPAQNEGVMMLIQTHDFSWNEGEVISEVSSKDDLNFVLESAIEDQGCSTTAPIPFKIIGQINRVDWSVVRGAQAPVEKVDNNIPVEIIGLYSAHNKEQFIDPARITLYAA